MIAQVVAFTVPLDTEAGEQGRVTSSPLESPSDQSILPMISDANDIPSGKIISTQIKIIIFFISRVALECKNYCALIPYVVVYTHPAPEGIL